jgi:hypothetical protein
MMKKSITLAIAAVVLTAPMLTPAFAGPNHYRQGPPHGFKQNHGYKQSYGYQQSNFNAWNAAALGAAVGVVVGVGGQYNRYVAPPPYGQFYSLPIPCRIAQIPVYDQFGRLIQYQQTCLN